VYGLDTRGSVVSKTDPMNRKTTYVPNQKGLITKVTGPDNKSTLIDFAGSDVVKTTDQLGRVTTRGFDALGREVVLADARGAITETSYTAASDIESVADPLGRRSVYEFDPNGNQTKVVDARGGETTYDYDLLDRVEKITDPLGAFEEFRYDGNGNQKSRTSRRGIVTEHDYDELNRRFESRYGTESTAKLRCGTSTTRSVSSRRCSRAAPQRPR
jgi:YD repeat-containing protein